MAVDMVNHPPHYTSTKYEVIDILEEFFKDDPLLWQCGKYLLRCKGKGNLEQDLSKMIWYAKRRMEREELIKNGENFYGHIFKGKYLDCGTLDGYVNSGIEMSKKKKL